MSLFNKLKEVLKIKLKDTVKIHINGVEYKGSNSIIVNQNKRTKIVQIDGQEILQNDEIKLEIFGDVGIINSTNADITCQNVSGNIISTNGDVVCNDVSGDVTSTNGDIKAKVISGQAKTTCGDIIIK